MENAYERSKEILTPKEFSEAITELHKLSRLREKCAPQHLIEVAADYYRLHSKVVDAYTNMWEKAEK